MTVDEYERITSGKREMALTTQWELGVVADAAIAELERERDEARAEAAVRERMLVAEYDDPTPKTAGYQRWWTDLRARAEEGSES